MSVRSQILNTLEHTVFLTTIQKILHKLIICFVTSFIYIPKHPASRYNRVHWNSHFLFPDPAAYFFNNVAMNVFTYYVKIFNILYKVHIRYIIICQKSDVSKINVNLRKLTKIDLIYFVYLLEIYNLFCVCGVGVGQVNQEWQDLFKQLNRIIFPLPNFKYMSFLWVFLSILPYLKQTSQV